MRQFLLTLLQSRAKRRVLGFGAAVTAGSFVASLVSFGAYGAVVFPLSLIVGLLVAVPTTVPVLTFLHWRRLESVWVFLVGAALSSVIMFGLMLLINASGQRPSVETSFAESLPVMVVGFIPWLLFYVTGGFVYWLVAVRPFAFRGEQAS
jgi:hypothetical protein